MVKELALWMAVGMQAAAPAPAAVDVTGTWLVSAEVSGVQVSEICTLKQAADAKITGSCDTATGKYDVTGSVTSGTVSFQHGGEYEGNKLVMSYAGKVGSDGQLAGTLSVDVYNVSGDFTAKKAAATPAPAATPGQK